MGTKLGQNFLTNEEIAKKIVESANIEGANVLEIGPGKGILTKYLAEKAGRVLAVEIDRDLIALLKKRYKNIEFVEDDILKINLPKLIEENNFQSYKVVANLPYYITSKITRLLLETKHPPQEMILMVQKEVGERIVANDGKESILSISVKFYAAPEILFYVPRENFNPVPEVDSVVIKIVRKKPARNASHSDAGGNIPAVDTKRFFSLLKAGFSAKRKMLANNLSSGMHISKERAVEMIKKAGLDPGIRAERLRLENWVRLYYKFKVKSAK